MTLDRTKLDAACAKADALSRRFASRSDLDPLLAAVAGYGVASAGAAAYHGAKRGVRKFAANRAVKKAQKVAAKTPGTAFKGPPSVKQQYSALPKEQKRNLAENYAYRGPKRADIDLKKIGRGVGKAGRVAGRKAAGAGAFVAGRAAKAVGGTAAVVGGAAGGLTGLAAGLPLTYPGKGEEIGSAIGGAPGEALYDVGQKAEDWGRKKFTTPTKQAEQQRQIRKKVIPGVAKTLAKRADIDPASLALAMHLKAATPQLRHQPHAEAHLGHKPPRRLPRPTRAEPEGNTTSGRRKAWSKPRVDANFSFSPRISKAHFNSILEELYEVEDVEDYKEARRQLAQDLIKLGYHENSDGSWEKKSEVRGDGLSVAAEPEGNTTSGRRKAWSKPRVDAEINLDKLHAKAEQLHGDNIRGKALFWGNMALRAFPSSPVQRAYQEQALKYRKLLEECGEKLSRGDGLSVAAALVAFLATVSISTLVTWGLDKIEEAKSLVRIAATGKLAPKDVAQIRRAMDKLKAAQKAAQDKRRPLQLMHQRLEPRFDRGDVNFKALGKRALKRTGATLKGAGRGALRGAGVGAIGGLMTMLPPMAVAGAAAGVPTGAAYGAYRGFKESKPGYKGRKSEFIADEGRGDAGSYFGLAGHVHPLTGHIFGVTKPVVDLTATGAATGTTLGGSLGVAGTAVTALAFLIAAASMGFLIKKGADWLRQKIDMLRLAKSEGKISAKDRVEIMAAIEKLKLARYRSEAIGREDADELLPYVAKGAFTVPDLNRPGKFKDQPFVRRFRTSAALHKWCEELKENNKGEVWEIRGPERGDIQSRGDFWKKPETGASLAKPAQSSPTEIGAFLNKAQQTKPSAATNAPAAGPAATAVAPSPAVAASTVPIRAEKPLTAKQQWQAGKPLKPKAAEKRAYNVGVKAFRPVQAEERAKHPANKKAYYEEIGKWQEARKQYRTHERAYNAFETETPPPGSAEARALEAKNQQKAQAAQAKVTATQQKTAQRAALKTQKAEAGKLKRHQKQYLAYERNDPPPGSGAYRRHHQKFGTLPQQPGEARPVAAG